MTRKLIHGILIGLVSAAAVLMFYFSGNLDWLENTTWDWRAKLYAAPGRASGQIRVIMIDQTSGLGQKYPAGAAFLALAAAAL
jgi:hypothetical protein